MTLPYSEGTAFLVPLRRGAYARGVVARASPKGKVLLGYFFGPRLTAPGNVMLGDLDASNAVLRVIFGDLGLIKGEWRIRGRIPHWDRSKWPMPDFVRRDPLGKRGPRLVRHSDADPLLIETEYPIDDDSGIATESLYGYGAVEIGLGKILG